MQARSLIRVLCFVMVMLTVASCSVTSKLPSGSYLLQKVRVESDKSVPKPERIQSEEVMKYIRQTPNKHFLGTDFYVWMYGLANPKKDNWWNNLKRNIGEEPVLLDMNETEKSAENLKIYLDSRGYFDSQVRYNVDTLSRKKRAKVTYSLSQHSPYIINRISYDYRDRFLAPILQPDTVNCLIRVGEIFDIAILDAERERKSEEENRAAAEKQAEAEKATEEQTYSEAEREMFEALGISMSHKQENAEESVPAEEPSEEESEEKSE